MTKNSGVAMAPLAPPGYAYGVTLTQGNQLCQDSCLYAQCFQKSFGVRIYGTLLESIGETDIIFWTTKTEIFLNKNEKLQSKYCLEEYFIRNKWHYGSY